MGQCQCRRRRPQQGGSKATFGSEFAREEGAGGVVPGVGGLMLYPMYVVKISDFLQMKDAPVPHQELLRRGIVVQHSREVGATIFVSHQWCGARHPDPAFGQLSVLQGALQHIQSGCVCLEVDFLSRMEYGARLRVTKKDLATARAIWYDYFAVPQPGAGGNSHDYADLDADLGKAVMSLPAYIDACEFFFILAPPVLHSDDPDRVVDLHSWKQRGWCRLERAARLFSPRQTHMLVVARPGVLCEVGAHEYLCDSVGEGTFSFESDKWRLSTIMKALLANKLRALLDAGDLHRFRHLLSLQHVLLRGLPAGKTRDDVYLAGRSVACTTTPLGDFLLDFKYGSLPTRPESLVELLHLATTAEEAEAVQSLLDLSVDPNARTSQNLSEFLVWRGDTALHRAACFASGPDIIKILVDKKADVEAKSLKGHSPLSLAAFAGHTVAVRALLDAGAGIDAPNQWGMTPLAATAIRGALSALRVLVAEGATAKASDEGVGPVLMTALYTPGQEYTTELLRCPGCDADRSVQLRRGSPAHIVVFAASLPHRLWGSRSFLSVLMYHMSGATPLMVAAACGNVAVARALISGGASTTRRNHRGRTAAEIADLAGFPPEVVAHFTRATEGAPDERSVGDTLRARVHSSPSAADESQQQPTDVETPDPLVSSIATLAVGSAAPARLKASL